MYRAPNSPSHLPTIPFLAFCLAAIMMSCTAPARVSEAHLDDFLSSHRIKLPDGLYRHVAATIKQRQSAYDGQYVPAGVDKYGSRVELTGGLKPGDPGEMLTVKTKDPGFRDRSLARVLMNWAPYLDRDFRREPSGEYPDPVTYYRAYARWKSFTNPRPEDEPAPRVFLFLPSHFMVQPPRSGAQDCDTQSLGGIVNLMLRVDGIEDGEARLAATHALISWLKGDQVTQVGPCPVAPIINDHTTGMGLFFVPIMMFPDATGANLPNLECPAPAAGQTLPPPCLQVAVADLLIKFTAVKTGYHPGLFDARFTPGLGGEAYRAFFDGCPSGAMYESLAHTDDAVVLANEGLEPDATLRENVMKEGRARTSDAIFRGLTLSSVISAERDEHGRPLVNGLLQHPPSGVPLEEASYFLHASMVHAVDGFGAALWSSSPHMMSALALNYAGRRAPAPGPHAEEYRPPAVGVREQWNENYKDLPAACGQTAELPIALTPHMEIYDSHIYLPHGDLAKLAERYNQITITEGEDRGSLETPEQWAAVGYVAAASEGETPRLLTFSECRAKGLSDEQCFTLFRSVFSAPYCGPLSRLRTSMSPEHSASTDSAGLPSPDDPVTQVFHENISETVKDTAECRDTVDSVIIDCAGCRFEDATPPPTLPNGKPSVLGEQLAFLWIHLWPYGSMYTLHDGDAQFPRYWSTDGDNGGALAGLMSFTRYQAGGESYPDPRLHDAAWFTDDVHGYFGAPVDRRQVRRPGRGDPMYLLRHFPKSLLKAGSNLPDPSFPREANACGCGE